MKETIDRAGMPSGWWLFSEMRRPLSKCATGVARRGDRPAPSPMSRERPHDVGLTMPRSTTGELDEGPRIDAETAIQEARVPSQFPGAPENELSPDSRTPETRVEAANSGRWS